VAELIFHILEYGMSRELKGQDLLVLLKQAAHPAQAFTYAALGEAVRLSASQVHRSVRRRLAAGLATSTRRGQWLAVRSALVEFAVRRWASLSAAAKSKPPFPFSALASRRRHPAPPLLSRPAPCPSLRRRGPRRPYSQGGSE
jgi:hypothetical protein